MPVIDGRALALTILEVRHYSLCRCAHSMQGIARQTRHYVDAGMRRPHLSIVRVGDNAASEVYVRTKLHTAKRVW